MNYGQCDTFSHCLTFRPLLLFHLYVGNVEASAILKLFFSGLEAGLAPGIQEVPKDQDSKYFIILMSFVYHCDWIHEY